MYNIQQKQEFIDYYCTDLQLHKQLTNLFEKLGKLEFSLELEKDFCNYSDDEIKLALSILFTSSSSSNRNNLYILRAYISWCMVNKKADITNNFLNSIDENMIDKTHSYKTLMLKDEKQLFEYLDMAWRPLEEQTIENAYRLYHLLVFNGLSNDEIVNLKISNIDFRNKAVVLKDRIVNISNDTFEVMDYVVQMETYKKHRSSDFIQEFAKNDPDYVITLAHNKKSTRKTLKKRLIVISAVMRKTIKESMGKDVFLKTKNILVSGIFYRIYTRELAGYSMDFSEIFYHIKDSREKIHHKNIKRDCFNSYRIWKKAFNLK